MISTSDDTLLSDSRRTDEEEVGMGAESRGVLSESFSGDGSRSTEVGGAGGGTISDIGVLGVGFRRAGSESLRR